MHPPPRFGGISSPHSRSLSREPHDREGLQACTELNEDTIEPFGQITESTKRASTTEETRARRGAAKSSGGGGAVARVWENQAAALPSAAVGVPFRVKKGTAGQTNRSPDGHRFTSSCSSRAATSAPSTHHLERRAPPALATDSAPYPELTRAKATSNRQDRRRYRPIIASPSSPDRISAVRVSSRAFAQGAAAYVRQPCRSGEPAASRCG